MANAETIRVEVVYARPDVQRLIALDVAPGTTMTQAVELSGVLAEFPEIELAIAPMGIFSKIVETPAARILQPGDRVELYRPLEMDPKEARKLRAERAKARRSQQGK